MPYVDDSAIHGLGVFADKDYAQGDTIELCPYLVADYDDVGDECVLHDYMFHTPYEIPKSITSHLVLLWSITTGKSKTLSGTLKMKTTAIFGFALKEIKKGEEILHDYGEQYWDSRNHGQEN